MRTVVYLSGGMQYARGRGSSWRSEIGRWIRTTLGHTIRDPVVESDKLMERLRLRRWNLRGRRRTGGDWDRFFRMVVDRDTRMVLSSDYVVCLWNGSARRGAGTQGELTVARHNRIPVYLVTRSRSENVPGWVRGCCTRQFRSFTALKQFLSTEYPISRQE